MSQADPQIQSTAHLRVIVARVSFERSCIDMGWRWEVDPIGVPDGPRMATAWRLRCSFRRPDRDTGEVGEGFGRWWLIEPSATVSSVVKTMFVAAKLILDHELMEAFKFDGERPFDPHRTVQDLVSLGHERASEPSDIWPTDALVYCKPCHKTHAAKAGEKMCGGPGSWIVE